MNKQKYFVVYDPYSYYIVKAETAPIGTIAEFETSQEADRCVDECNEEYRERSNERFEEQMRERE